MKKYKTINFLEKHKKGYNNSKIYITVVAGILILLFADIYWDIKEIEDLKIYISKNPHEKYTLIEDMGQEYININQIKNIYNLMGNSNITKFITDNSKVEIEGVCQDLALLEKIKDYDSVCNMSIDKIKKEENNYLYKISYDIGGKNETE
ncbi:MAG: hypothetical protein RSD22_05260 [Romboutsia sp.]